MGSFILFLLFIVVFIILFILSAGFSILRAIFNFFTGNTQSTRRNGNQFFGDEKKESHNDSKNHGEKVFSKDEGEYVDFVEFKEEDKK